MGVRGLTTYINSSHDVFLKDFLLHDTKLVIDGHSLCAQLYHCLRCFSAFGGDYDKYATYVKTFFKHLRKCNVVPYVIFDGAYETKKLKTVYNRLRSKINGTSRLDPVTQGCLQIFPLLIREVFKEAVQDMEVSFTVCEFEADDEIAAMARHLDCPVLSYDSDFFIYNVTYIPFNTLELKPKQVDQNGVKIYGLECKVYRVQYLIKHFGGIKEEMLPLLATLLGNDYVEKRVFNKFFSQLKLPKGKKQKNEQQRCIHGLFKWLLNESLDTAMAKIIGRLKKNQKDKVFTIIKKSIEGYNNKYCNSLKYFKLCEEAESSKIELVIPEINADHTEEDSDELSEDELEESNNSDDSDTEDTSNNNNHNKEPLSLPKWMSKGIRSNTITSLYVNLYIHHLYFCSPQAEDYTEEDSFLSALPILRYSFDLLTDYAHENFIYVSRENNTNYKRLFIGTEYSVPRLIDKPYPDLTNEELKKCFYHLLNERMPNFDINLIQELPENFKLYMIAILWWVLKCKVPLEIVHSLLISYIMLEVIDEKTGSFRGHNFFNNKYSKKIQELNQRNSLEVTEGLFLNKNKVLYEDCLIAASVLLKHFEIDDSIKKKPKSYDTKRMHSLAQFQCILYQLNCLNNICMEPFLSTKYSKCFNGTFVYNIALKLENQGDPENFIEKYIKGSNTVLLFYKSLSNIYKKCAETLNLVNAKIYVNKRRGRRKKKQLSEMEEEVNFIVKGFLSEVVI